MKSTELDSSFQCTRIFKKLSQNFRLVIVENIWDRFARLFCISTGAERAKNENKIHGNELWESKRKFRDCRCLIFSKSDVDLNSGIKHGWVSLKSILNFSTPSVEFFQRHALRARRRADFQLPTHCLYSTSVFSSTSDCVFDVTASPFVAMSVIELFNQGYVDKFLWLELQLDATGKKTGQRSSQVSRDLHELSWKLHWKDQKRG